MTVHQFAQRVEPADGETHADAVHRAVERGRAAHREHCPVCTCTETVRVETIRTTWAVDDVAGAPVGITEATTPMVSITYKKDTSHD